MPSRCSYQIANVEEGKAAQQDQSYRSCIITLLIFFFLCIILIIPLILFKPYHSYYPNQQIESIKETQHQLNTGSTKYSLDHTTSVIDESIEEFETTSRIIKVNREHFPTKNTLLPPTKEDESKGSTNRNTTEVSTSTELNQIYQKVSLSRYESEKHTTDRQLANTGIIDEYTSTEVDKLIPITERYKSKDSTNKSNTEASTSTNEYESDRQLTSSEIINESVSTEMDILSSTTEEYKRKNSTDMNATEASIHPILSTVDDSTTSEPITHTTTTVPESTTEIDNEVCTTGECKNLASKMLFYMNHTIDPCEDFYEYACGGFEANPQVIERTLEDVAHQRILHQMQKENNASSSFAKYYNSCIQYETISQTERIKLAKEALSKIGNIFNTKEEWDKNPVNFTDLVAKLLLYNSPLLFDVTPDLDEFYPKQFTLKIGPTTINNPFDTDEMSDPCHTEQFDREKNNDVDLKELYRKYIQCKNDTVELGKSNVQPFNELGICNLTDLSCDHLQGLNTTNTNIDIKQKFLAIFPSKDKIREAYLMKNYTLYTIEKLQENFKIINWTQLIKALTKKWIKPNTTVQVYFSDALAKGMENLYMFADNQMDLHNALLRLYASKLYHEFVLSKHEDAKKHCLRVATNILNREASNLYISSFSKDQLTYMNRTIHSLFSKLKETLKLNVRKVKWITQDEYDNVLIAKIDNLQIAVPNISDYLSEKQENQVNLSNNYFENSMTLMKRYRELMYADELFSNPGNPEQIWTHYATPYQSKGLAIYGLNLIVIPFGAIDWSFKYDEDQFDYVTLATAGSVIAHEIAHHFDANGIYYWNGTRDTHNTPFNKSDSTNMNFENYIENQRNTYSAPMNIMLPFTQQNVIYEISQLTLNERLSEAMGLRLAYDTLHRLRSSKEVNLPWLKLHFDQLFYLAYAQMHCTKSPLTSSYVSLYENEYLPSRIRILVSASNNKLLGKAWNCAQGSSIMPSYTCSAFPYLECN
ncbi:unnamed protein product [Xylocopa violacea]|uniref:Endothelin-converting enzyme 1 n=1 Tax=Xylocopa violacea TaxID=135666 RepID=A0ABP1N8F7_XYLVO